MDVFDSVSEFSSDILHGCLELFVGIDDLCTWDTVVFTKLPSLVSTLMLFGGNSGIPLATRMQPSCYMWMHGVCMRPAQCIGQMWVWRLKEIDIVVDAWVGVCPNAL